MDASGNKDEGAGDQGIMFGYACRETPELMPAPIHYAHAILRALSQSRHDWARPLLGPDAKSQVTLEYRDGKPVRAASVVVSAQHNEKIDQHDVRDLVRPHVMRTLPDGWMCDDSEFYVNPTGRFVIGGPDGDCGLTGRKIIVDTYGGAAPHGGGAFSGKDPSKVDRSAAYAARYLAKNVVAAGLAERCTIQLSYAIGVSKPLSVYVNTEGTGEVDEQRLSRDAAGDDGSEPARNPQTSGPEPPDLCAHRRLWPFRARPGSRRRILLGTHRSRAGAAKRVLIRTLAPNVTIEVTAREPDVGARLRDGFCARHGRARPPSCPMTSWKHRSGPASRFRAPATTRSRI